MIDVHVLTHSGTRPEWLAQCLESLEGHPVVVHVVEGVEGSVGAGRAKGFALGDCEFVSYVDSDDFVLPGHFEKCLTGLEDHRSVVCVERVILADNSCGGTFRRGHNGAVYRRADIERLLLGIAAAAYTCDSLTRRELSPKQLLHVGCVWRVHGRGAHRKIAFDISRTELLAWREALRNAGGEA